MTADQPMTVCLLDLPRLWVFTLPMPSNYLIEVWGAAAISIRHFRRKVLFIV